MYTHYNHILRIVYVRDWESMFLCCRYVEEHIQRTGVAIETQGFSFVTSGRKRESLTVSMTLPYIFHESFMCVGGWNWHHWEKHISHLLYNNCCLGFREMQRSISIRTSNHCKALKVCCWILESVIKSRLQAYRFTLQMCMNLCLKHNCLWISGVSEYLGTEICTSRQKRFSLVTFVDTPGLVDGDMKYPFDVDQAVLWLGACLSLVICVSRSCVYI